MRNLLSSLAITVFIGATAIAKEGNVSFTLKSPVFPDGKPIPEAYTCDGPDQSPPLAWSGAPAGTKSFALIADDPDAPGHPWVHWVIYNLPAKASELKPGIPGIEKLEDGAKQGKNDFGHIGYGGPCPPSGTHRSPCPRAPRRRPSSPRSKVTSWLTPSSWAPTVGNNAGCILLSP